MSHTRSFKKEKKQKQVRSTSYKKNNKITKEEKQKSKNTFNNIKEFNLNTCMNTELNEIRKMADNQNIIYNTQTSKIDLCNKLTSHQRNIFIGNKISPFLKQQIFSNNIFKNNINNTVENSDCNLCKV
jgi:hypothetical protein